MQKEQWYCDLVAGKEYIKSYINEKDVIYIRNFKLRDIISEDCGLGLQKYYALCGVTNYKSRDLSGLSNLEKEAFYERVRYEYATFIAQVIKCDKVQYVDECFRIYNGENYVDLNESGMEKMFKCFKEIYCLNGKRDDKFTGIETLTEEARHDIEIFRDAERRADIEENGLVSIDSIIIGVCSKHTGYTLHNILDLTMWQLMNTYKILNKIDKANQYAMILASGNLDVSKSKIKPKDLDWSVRSY